MQTSALKPNSLKVWLLAIRPQTLLVSVVPILVGCACVYVEVHQMGAHVREVILGSGMLVMPAVACLMCALFLQMGTNLANDVFDFEKGADTDARVGPTRTVHLGLLTPFKVKAAMMASFAIAFFIGLYLVAIAGVWILAIGVCSILAAYVYTGGPFPLAYNGLGEVFVFVFFGFVAVCGTSFVYLAKVPKVAWLASIPVGLLAVAILVVNNFRDRHTDPEAGKKTLAVFFGKTFSKAEYVLCYLVSFSAVVMIRVYFDLSVLMMLPLVLLPWALKLILAFMKKDGKELNPLLASSAKFLFVFGILFSIGLVVSTGA